jgi:hypothetical protein
MTRLPASLFTHAQISIDQVCESLRNMIDPMESNRAIDVAIKTINDKGHNNGFIR